MKRAIMIGVISLCLASFACGLSSPTPAPTLTPRLPTSTASSSPAPPSSAGQPSLTPLAPTVTLSPSSAVTPSAAPHPTLAPPTLSPTQQPTTTPSRTPPAAINCDVVPAGNFLSIWQNNPSLQTDLNCPTSNHPQIQPDAWVIQTAYQTFEHGSMIWSNQIGWFELQVIYVLYNDGSYLRYDDTFDPAVDPTAGGETPPSGLVEPVFGFGKLWREQSGVRAALGWATAGELGGSGRFQLFRGGDMIWISQTNKTYVFTFHTSTVTVFNTPF